ncbi:nectin-2-like [Chiloscyllium plagiosum]|uniref:nectin-2-like n=1 Tax=Chiloscyllium plagiosum TaxID=36176 RepID=UPI001CB86184|nr:nectin-2-like [Chiloscyllium plagiosum]
MPTEIGWSEALVASCTAANGKPPANVTWNAKLQGRVTSTRRENPDGTVTVFSQYRIIPSRKANGQNVTCVVSHDALTAPVSLPVTLSVLCKYDIGGALLTNSVSTHFGSVIPRNSGVVPERARIAGDQLIIEQVDYSVNGTWICEATNKLGKGKGEIIIVVREPDSLRAGKFYGSTMVLIVTGTIIGILIIIVSLAIVIVKKQKTMEDGKSDAQPFTRKRSHITVFATLNLNVLDGANSSKTDVNETGATVNADVNVN